MESPGPEYIHGTHPEEQKRLSRLNALLNASSLQAMPLRADDKILDVGSGLGQFSRLLARKTGSRGSVIAVEGDPRQLAEAHRQAVEDGEETLVDFRLGDAVNLPLEDHEWGSFDLAHARFILEHVTDPLAVVRSMVRAVRPGGRIILEDDDHEILRLTPEPPGVLDLWRAYYRTYEKQGKDPFIGRNLVTLLCEAGAEPRGNSCLNFGSAAGSPNFVAMIDNFIAIIDGARKEILSFDLAGERQIDEGLATFRAWRDRPDAAMWYTTSWAEGVRPSVDLTVAAAAAASPSGTRGPEAPTGGASMLEFLMNASADLSSSLKLNKVFHKIARSLRPVIDYHLFCVQLWNEETQLLEHSFSMKYGEEIPQKGGFPLGYGLCGSCAVSRRPIRVANVKEDPRYVRFRHPEVEIRSELAVPLLFKDQLIGVLDLESTEFDSFTEEQEQMVSALASHIAAALVNARLFERVQHDEQRMERDLAMARETQRGLLPTADRPRLTGLDIGAAYAPARELGGDFYDFLDYGSGRMAVAVGDVAGKSTPAALLAAMAIGLLRAHVVERVGEPAAMLADLNEHLRAFGQPNRFVAMAFAVYDEESRTLKIANAGLPRILLASANGTDEIPLVGLPLGMFHDIQYEEKTLKARKGDAVIFCSDGLLECENPDGEAFGVERLRGLLGELRSRTAQEIADELNRATVRFAGDGSRQHDDHTVVVLKFV